jgi:hypothetical protein
MFSVVDEASRVLGCGALEILPKSSVIVGHEKPDCPQRLKEPRAGSIDEGRARPSQLAFSPFLDPSGMLGFSPLTSPEGVVFSDGEKALYGGADRVRAAAG